MTADPKDAAKAAVDRMDAGAVPVTIPPDSDQPEAKVIEAPTNAEAIDAHLADLVSRPPGVPTGFVALDEKIMGLRPGLIVLSAPPGAGKTTFVWQIADQVAAAGTPVLFFSYEMSRGELMNKTLARVCGLDNRQIMEGKVDRGFLKAGIEYIRRHGQLVRVVEGESDLRISDIRQLVQGETAKSGKAPVVFIDYLQIIPNMDRTLDRRGNVDLIVSELRRIARDLKAPVVAVSSIARSSYATGGTSLAAFKESGGIEFTADVAIVLQVPKDAADNSKSSAAVQAEFGQRRIKANIVKNRRGGQWSIPFIYNMSNDDFILDGEPELIPYWKTLEDKEDRGR